MKTMNEYLKEFENKSDNWINRTLSDTLEMIEFLESIYITGAKNNFYSKELSNSAYNERQQLCQITSALYHIKRNRNI